MKTILILLFAALFINGTCAKEYHVSKNGNNKNPGALEAHFKTIQAAADLAQPGNLITVHEGIYRECINPPRGGRSDNKRIVYQAASSEKVVIKGSEIIKTWKKVQEGIWKVTLSNQIFGDYNPYMEDHERMVKWENWIYIRNARPQFSNWTYAHANQLSYLDLFELEKQNELTTAQANVFLEPRPAEMLFNIDEDYHQLNNLAEDPEHLKILEFMRSKLNQWQDETGDTTPDSLTHDDIDRISYNRMGKDFLPEYRGIIPGSERNASTINNSGPR